MKYGFIYEIFKAIIEGLKYLSLVELFKLIAKKLNPIPLDESKATIYSRVSVDIYITLKWILLIIFLITSLNGQWSCLIIWYLIITNIHTYFYYHVWDKAAINLFEADEHCLRRRFINLLLAIAFSNISFAYLYSTYYSNGFNWGSSGITKSHAIWYSISNSVAANYNSISPIDDTANSVSMIQLLITFLFVTIIISRSIPQKS
jgi:hypothetical protein